MKNKIHKWTTESLHAESLKYNTRAEFQKYNCSAYNTALKRNLIDEICQHMHSKHILWTDSMLLSEALKYTSKSEFQHKSSSAYVTAKNRKILNNICSHMKVIRKEWTYELLCEEALKYETRMAFYTGSKKAYDVAYRRNILDNICEHMEQVYTYWTDDMLREEALKYNTRSEFRHKSSGAYCVSKKRKIINEICCHMERGEFSFNADKPAILYYIRFDSELNTPIYKIGITNKSVSERILTMGINKIYTPVIIEEFYFEKGKEAYDMEKLYNKEFMEYRYFGDAILNNGNTELFTTDVLQLDRL